ncbi:hypothetical protein RR48_14999 [Papilio machaon]|uniref:Uncharacterized protein n=1 Tax=Papilio machaon TaxID=76193 RepID=A0A194R282_PAPMA|nr:hypothetical protein RR48_14999 [Papilio machaon]
MNYLCECQNEIISLADLNERVREATENNVIIILIRDNRSEEDKLFSDNNLREWGANFLRGKKLKKELPDHVYNLYYSEVDKRGCTINDTIHDKYKSYHALQNFTMKNTSFVLKENRKAVLIINNHDALRNGANGGSVNNLLYIDYDDSGNKLNEFWMYNLEDVARFFEIFLDTRICHTECES